jgi:hypothetical protein
MFGRIVLAACLMLAATAPVAEAGDPGSKGNTTSTTKTQTWHKGETVIPGQRGSDGRSTGRTGKNIPPGLPGAGTPGCPVGPSFNLDQIFNNVLNCLMPPAEAYPSSPSSKASKIIQNMIKSIDGYFSTSVSKVPYVSPTIFADPGLATADPTGVTGRPCLYGNTTRTLHYSPVYLEFLINEGLPTAVAAALAHEFGHHANRLVKFKPKSTFEEEQRADLPRSRPAPRFAPPSRTNSGRTGRTFRQIPATARQRSG